MVELIGGVNAAVLADATDLIVLLGTRWGSLHQELDRAGEVFAELPAWVIDVTFHFLVRSSIADGFD
jgi:hypothetical protein